MTPQDSTATPQATFWNRLDGIVVINLDERTDRWRQVKSSASHLTGAPPFQRLSAVCGIDLPGYGLSPWFRGRISDKRWAGRAGCTQSHRKVMAFAKRRGWKTFLVLEDDAAFRALEPSELAALDDALFRDHSDWDVCYLGFSKTVGISLALRLIGHGQLCEIIGCYTTHAYLVRDRARDWILGRLAEDEGAWAWHSQHRIIDRWYARHLSKSLKVFAVTPSIISQQAGFSDIVQRQVDYDDEFSGRIDRITRSRFRFACSKWLWHLSMPVRDTLDGVRGLMKRLRGF